MSAAFVSSCMKRMYKTNQVKTGSPARVTDGYMNTVQKTTLYMQMDGGKYFLIDQTFVNDYFRT